jgi:hypothetical protein
MRSMLQRPRCFKRPSGGHIHSENRGRDTRCYSIEWAGRAGPPSIIHVAMLSSSTPPRACDGRSDTTSFPLLTFHAPSRDTWTRLGHAHFNKCTSRIDAARFGVLGLYIYEKTVCTRGGGGEARGGKREGKATSCV